jgi:hypothetical protein
MKNKVRSGVKEKERNGLKMDRRKFLKWSAFTGAAVGASKIMGQFNTPAASPL